jgi:hypothetical protein
MRRPPGRIERNDFGHRLTETASVSPTFLSTAGQVALNLKIAISSIASLLEQQLLKARQSPPATLGKPLKAGEFSRIADPGRKPPPWWNRATGAPGIADFPRPYVSNILLIIKQLYNSPFGFRIGTRPAFFQA